MSIAPIPNSTPAHQPATPVQAPVTSDHDKDDAGGAAKPSTEKGVGELLDKTA